LSRVGQKLGRYELVEQLGKGAAGTVFRARDTLLGIDVCVKVLHSGLATQPGIIERFKRELLLARRIAHPSICKIFDIQQHGDTHFLTMEYVKGETLSTILNRDGAMPVLTAVRVLRKVAEALGAAHSAGVVHRDVKPGNIIIDSSGRVTIVDFGVATAQDLDRLTRAGVVLGSRSYLAPEAWQGLPATAAGDVWALGVILYGCVTGRLPYKGEGMMGVFDAIKNTKPLPPSDTNADVTPEVEAVIFKAMAVELADRYPDANAVDAALLELERSLESVNMATSIGVPASRPPPPWPKAPATREVPSDTPQERLHRPAGGGLPAPPPSAWTPPPAAPPRSAPATSMSSPTIMPAAGELSLYAGDGSLEEDMDRTRITPPPSAPSAPPESEARPAGPSLDSVGAAFDAAFGLSGELPVVPEQVAAPTRPAQEGMTQEAFAEDIVELRGMSMMLGQKVLTKDGEEKRPEPGQRGMSGFSPKPLAAGREPGQWAAKASGELIDFPEPKQLRSLDPLGAASPNDMDLTTVHGEPSEAAGIRTSPDRTAAAEGSFFPDFAASDVTQMQPQGGSLGVDVTRDLSAASADDAPLSLDDSALSPLPEPARAPALQRRKALIAAGGGALLLIVLLFVVVGGAEEPAMPELPEAPLTAGKADPWSFDPPAVAEQPVEAEPVEAEPVEAEPVEAEPVEAEPVEAEPVEAEPVEAEPVEAEPVEAEPVKAEPVFEDDPTPVVAKATPPQPRAQRPPPSREQGAATQAARARYLKKKKTLDSALAQKGLLPGDSPAVDRQRSAMNKSARQKEWDQAGGAADEALREAKKVDLNAAFVGAKLARFNQRYDKVSDASERDKLKIVLKEVGADFSKGRYEEANKKLNRAFALLR
jgi:eukaryotic-like serine/threonine-protein kinase